MASEPLRYLLSLALASSVGMIAALAFRRPIRRIFGARAAYGLWLLVPIALLAVLLPHAHETSPAVGTPWTIGSVSSLIDSPHRLLDQSPPVAPSSIDWPRWALGVWGAGVALFVLYLAGLQRAFVKSLGTLSGSRGVLRAERSAGCPALLGVLRPKVILPSDFESRYTRPERLLVLCHERTHLRRGDAVFNALVASMRCLFWFNPIVHVASRCFRVDQELACDAAVLNDHPGSRRTYATAMLKTQLTEGMLPVGCHWRSAHDLKERVRMLQRPMPSRRRRLCGGALTALLSLVVGCTAWVAHAPAGGPKSPSAITPAQSPVTGPVGLTADKVFLRPATRSQPAIQVIQGHGRLVLPSGVKLQLSADRMTSGPTQILQGHVQIATISLAGEEAHPQMILQTDRAILAWQPDRSLVIQFEKGTLQQVPAGGLPGVGALTSPLSLTAPSTPQFVTPNFVDADLSQVAAAVGLATHRTFTIDPRIHVRVTMLSSAPMTPEALYQAFLGILSAHGLAALPAVADNVGFVQAPRPDVVRPGDSVPAPGRVVGPPLGNGGEAIWIVPSTNAR